MNLSRSLFPLTVVASHALACGSSEPKTANDANQGVPANSVSEARLAGEDGPRPTPSETEPTNDPTKPVLTSVDEEGDEGSGGTTASATPGKGGKSGKKGHKKSGGAKKSGPKVSRAQCNQLLDKFIDLAVGSDSRFAGIPPAMLKTMKMQARSQATQQKGDPCAGEGVTRSEYDCGMAAETTAEWQKCLE